MTQNSVLYCQELSMCYLWTVLGRDAVWRHHYPHFTFKTEARFTYQCTERFNDSPWELALLLCLFATLPVVASFILVELGISSTWAVMSECFYMGLFKIFHSANLSTCYVPGTRITDGNGKLFLQVRSKVQLLYSLTDMVSAFFL